MSNFICLTSANGNPIRINMDLIEAFGTITEKTYPEGSEEYIGMTYLVPAGMSGDDEPYIVKETNETVHALAAHAAINRG